ncbi:kinase-like protein [Rhizopogon vinicolor AM-OR11-026]|uniref:Kinase-like protein n=1 Tax=Rhizopogon vinicolor AM-OR11-026 TaxID=1314800 RepID=A0A1B7MHB2_9AGAM|nr:kinase-like protein [Rhizopogon vinicolor AM-OR11-026]
MADIILIDINTLVDFKIKPIFIPSSAVKKLETYPHNSGGFSDVWKCSMSTPSGRLPVAVKSIKVIQSDNKKLQYKAGRGIRREAYVWTQLSHDHILPLEGITNDFESLPALISLWMVNGSLNDYLKRDFPQLSDSRKSGLIRQVVAGLSYLHGKGIVHGDLTGANILVDDSGSLRIADFALSMPIAEAGDEMFSSSHVGTLRWLAPEFVDINFEGVEGKKPTKPGDIYAFGCVMLQILSGKTPYSWITPAAQITVAIASGQEPFKHRVHMNMGEVYEPLSSRCLSKIPEQRPSIVEITTIVGPVKATPSPNIPRTVQVQSSVDDDRSSRGAEILTDRLAASHPHDTRLFINMFPVQDLGPTVNDKDTSLLPLKKYMEGNNFDLRGISNFLSSTPDPNLQCAALQSLEHAAEWQSINFTECMSVIFDPVAKLLDSGDSEVRYAALDTLKHFLGSPRATDIVKSMMLRRVVDVVCDNLNAPDPEVQLAAVELLDAATRFEEILVKFSAAVSRISSLLSSMPTATQVTALRVLEVCAGSSTPELVKAVADTFQSLIVPLSSPETTVQIATLKVLEAGARTKDPELYGAFKAISPVLTKIQSSCETDVRSAARTVLQTAAQNDQLIDTVMTISPLSLVLGKDHARDVGKAGELSGTAQPSHQPQVVNFKKKPTIILIPAKAVKKIGKFPIGTGGLGDVWMCSWRPQAKKSWMCFWPRKSSKCKVAVKSVRIYQSHDKELVEKIGKRIHREAHVWIDLDHDNILKFLGIVEGFGLLPALVTAWMENGSLDSYLRQHTDLSKVETLRMLRQIAAGLKYLHDKGVVHGDLTCTNVLIDDDGKLHLADFSLSMILAESQNSTFNSCHAGNVRWMAPEMLAMPEQEGVTMPEQGGVMIPTKAADIYSYGCIMLQLFSGRLPYSWLTQAMHVTMTRVRGIEPFPARQIASVEDGYKLYSLRCLSNDSGDRPAISEIVEFLDEKSS